MAEFQSTLQDRQADPDLAKIFSVLDIISSPAICVAANGEIVAVNHAASEALGLSRKRLIGRHARNIDPRIADWPGLFASLKQRSSLILEPVQEGTDPRVSAHALKAHFWQPGDRELAVITIEDVRDEQARKLATDSRDAVLQAVRKAATRFLADEDWGGSCNKLLRDVGKATGVSRVYIFEAHFDDDERLLFSQRYEWVAPGITPEIDNPELQNIPMNDAGYGRWLELLSRGQLVVGQVQDFPESERALLDAQSIKSILVVPIFTGNKWWGMMGFDECTAPRVWGVPESQALRTVASLLGLATERREAAREAREKRDSLAHEARLIAMGEMASSVAHEINQPLSAISNYCETALAALDAGQQDHEILNRSLRGAASQAQRAGEIIRRLREFIRKGDTTRSSVDLNQLIRETISLVEHDARAHDIEILSDCEETLPSVDICRIQIQQVLFNLLRNSLEAIRDRDAGGDRKILVRSIQPHEHLVRVEVRDTGPGLTPGQASWIFDPFETSKPQGMGLGLSISRTIMESHGGTLAIDPGVSDGACFQVNLPCTEYREDD